MSSPQERVPHAVEDALDSAVALGQERYFPVEELGEDVEFVGWFSTDAPTESLDVAWNLRLLQKHLPPNMVPVGAFSSGDLLLVRLTEGQLDGMYFWDLLGQDHFFDGDKSYRVADDIPDFQEKLRSRPRNGRGVDTAKANKSAGHVFTPEGFTWHYHKGTTQMLLVPTSVHRQTYFA